MKKEIFISVFKCFMHLCLPGAFFLGIISCKKSDGNNGQNFELPAPPKFSIYGGQCKVPANGASGVPYSAFGLFTIQSESPKDILQCIAWGSAVFIASGQSQVSPCVLFAGPAVLRPELLKKDQVEVDCLSSVSYLVPGSYLKIYVSCTNYYTGQSSVNSLVTSPCTTQ